RDVGLGLRLPVYVSGSASVGWWAMFITMIGDIAAFSSLVFGYFYFWTIHDDFPPAASVGPGAFWPVLALGLVLAAWALTWAARALNARGRRVPFYLAIVSAALCALAGGAALLAGPWLHGMDPPVHPYPATVWLLAEWPGPHVAGGVSMRLDGPAGRMAGRMGGGHDSDLHH